MKYLFRAHFQDGSSLTQPRDDVSALAPGRKSAAFDLAERAKASTLVCLELVDGDEVVASVNQRTGLFLVGGVGFAAPGAPLPKGFAWVEGDPAHGPYYRTNRVHLNLAEGATAHEVAYVIGTKAQAGVRNFLEVS